MAEYEYGKVLEARHRWLEEYWNRVSKSVVRIQCNSRMWGLGLHATKQGFGSGFVLCQNEGRVLVITCGHVISDYFSDNCLSMKIIVSFSNGFETKDVSILSTAKHCEREIGLLAVRAPELLEIPAFEIARDLSLGCTDVYMVSFPNKNKSSTHGIGNLGSLHECGLEWQTKQDGFEDLIITDDLWIWHAFFGTPGSCNGINVLQRSPVFDDIINNRAPQVLFTVNGNNYNKRYYLTDGIYPKWSTFIDAIAVPQTLKDKLFTTRQESARKDVERAFGVLQARFAIIRKPALAWSVEVMWKIMMTCIIINNMIVEDERDTYLNYKDPLEFAQEQPENMPGSSSTKNATTFIVTPGQYDLDNFSRLIASRGEIRDRQVCEALKNDLVEHLWARSRSSVEN